MASVGISIPPPEPGTSPVSAHTVQQYDAFQRRRRRRNSSADGGADRTEAGAAAEAATVRLARKRSCSFHADHKGVKRRRQGIVPPTKFLLGGNISDPLNLGSLNDEEANRIANANTPVSSPMPTPKYRKEPIEVIIPSDVSDPLGLNGPEEALLSPSAQRRRRARKKRKHPSGHGPDRSVSVFEPAARGCSEPPPGRSVSEGAELHSPLPLPAAEETEGTLLKPEVVDVSEGLLQFRPCTQATPPRVATPEPERPDTNPTAVACKSPVSALAPSPAKAERSVTTPAVISAASSTPAAVRPASLGTPGSVPPARAGRPHGRKPSDEIVSPALPQPGARPLFARASARGAADGQPPVFRAKDAKFQYGNYNRYYGYRNPGQVDLRLGWLKSEWFRGKDVLDVGCNVGHVTLTVARDYHPRRCVGIDIDSSLIKTARQNVKHYQRSGDFPSSLALLYGDLVPPHKAPGTQFPRNVTFVHGNYVLESDAQLATVRPEFDTIVCLSITKWVHLNYGDAGLRRFFRRAFLSLRPGGRLLLEPQPWASYLKKKKLTPRIWENFQGLRLRPDTFPDLLISDIGFERYLTIGRPHHSSKGFSRQLQLFIKASEPTPSAAPSLNSVRRTATGAGEPSTTANLSCPAVPGTPCTVAMETTTSANTEPSPAVAANPSAAQTNSSTVASAAVDREDAHHPPCENTNEDICSCVAGSGDCADHTEPTSQQVLSVPVSMETDHASGAP